jgi:actin-related protein 6
LPNFSLGTSGRIQKPEENEELTENDQIVRLALERFQVPELLFNPSDGLIQQCGLHEAVHEAILRCAPVQQPILYRNIMAIGGNIEFENFRARMLEGIRGLANDEFDVRVGDPKNPSEYGWVCAAKLARSANFDKQCVTREEWQEVGHRATETLFNQI